MSGPRLGYPGFGDVNYDDTEDITVNYSLESQADGRSGEDNETAVQRILWDLFDTASDSRDNISVTGTVVIPPATFFNVQNAPPVPPRSFKAGSAVPMQWQFKRGSTVVNSALVQHRVTVSGPIPGGTLVITNTDPGGSSFRYSATTNTWQFNLQTKLPNGANYPVGLYQLTITPTTAGFLGTSFGLTLVK